MSENLRVDKKADAKVAMLDNRTALLRVAMMETWMESSLADWLASEKG